MNQFSKARRKKRQRRGAAAVEFAIVAPLFIMLVFGMIEFGRMVMVQQVITNASREGARRAVVDASTIEDVRDVVEKYSASSSITVPRENITINPDPAVTANGDPITVSVSLPFADISWLPTPQFLESYNLQAVTVMRRDKMP